MTKADLRMLIVSRLLTLSLSTFLTNFIVITLFIKFWDYFNSFVNPIPLFLSGILWIIVPILLALITIHVVLMLDLNFFSIYSERKHNFYLLSWILFLGMIVLSVLEIRSSKLSMSILAAISTIFLFKLYRLPERAEKDVIT